LKGTFSCFQFFSLTMFDQNHNIFDPHAVLRISIPRSLGAPRKR